MKAKSEQKIQDAIQNQMGKFRKLLEESIFLGNSFFLTGQSLPETDCKDKIKIEIECGQNSVEYMSHK
ncbi:Uncharacterised protein [Legionella sainthelensi]|uniref:hypothetical protein n=1 Tax=Legionella sainthelensi TaxID=28087 RepID=UPI000E1FD6E0|nr:hypothetical protein [Legionella sainthelensi]VEB35604.1 Uncharacterised protein [Legionella sainthelensi]